MPIQCLLQGAFGVRISRGRLSSSVQKAAEALAEPYVEIGQEVRSTSAVHADERSWRVEKNGT